MDLFEAVREAQDRNRVPSLAVGILARKRV